MEHEDTLKEKTLEQLAQKLRRLLPRVYHTWIKELVSRAHVAYVQALDSELAANGVSGASHVTREGVIESNRRLRAQVQQFKETLEAKNTELDALGYVWCTGGCAGGQHRYTEPKEISSDMIARLVGVVLRIYTRGANSGVIDERKNQWQTQRITRAFSRIAKVGEHRVDFLSKMVDAFRDGTNMERHVENLSVVTYMKNNDDIIPNVSGMLAELLAKRIVVVDAFNKLCLQGDDWFNQTLYPIELSDIQGVHEAATKEGGLWVWVIENHKTTNKPCGHVVTQLKTLGLWKTDWDNLK